MSNFNVIIYMQIEQTNHLLKIEQSDKNWYWMEW